MKTREMLIAGMFFSAAALSFSMANLYEVKKTRYEVTQFIKDLVLTDIEEGSK